jgi:hypothetical protein
MSPPPIAAGSRHSPTRQGSSADRMTTSADALRAAGVADNTECALSSVVVSVISCPMTRAATAR